MDLRYIPIFLLFFIMSFSISSVSAQEAVLKSKSPSNPSIIKKRIKTEQLDFTFPQLQKMADRKLESRINSLIVDKVMEIKEKSGIDEKDLPKTTFYVSYLPPYLKNNLLSIRFNTMYYVKGTAHPTNLIKSITIDLTKGTEVKLDDLFKPSSNYRTRLNDWMKKEIKEKDITISEMFKGIEENQGYYLTDEALVVYYNEYTPHVVGPLVFTFPYHMISDMLRIPL